MAVAMISRRRRWRFKRAAKRWRTGRGKIAIQFGGEVRILRHVGIDQRLVQPDLAVAQDDGEFRARQSLAGLAPLGDFLLGRQELQGAIQIAGALQRADHECGLAQALLRVEFAGADRLTLQVIVAQHQRRHFIGHLHQQPIAGRARDFPRANGAIQQDLQVHLDVRSVHAGGIVDEVGVEPAAAARKLDAPELREAEIAAFADDLAVKFVGIDAHRVVAAVADVAVAFAARLDVGADAAVPQQIHVGFEYGLDDFVRSDLSRQFEQRSALRATSVRLLAPREYTPPPLEIALASNPPTRSAAGGTAARAPGTSAPHRAAGR